MLARSQFGACPSMVFSWLVQWTLRAHACTNLEKSVSFKKHIVGLHVCPVFVLNNQVTQPGRLIIYKCTSV